MFECKKANSRVKDKPTKKDVRMRKRAPRLAIPPPRRGDEFPRGCIGPARKGMSASPYFDPLTVGRASFGAAA